MDKNNKLLYGLLGLWCFFAIAIGSNYILDFLFKLFGLESSTGLNFIFSIIIFGLIINSFVKSDDEVKENDINTLISCAHFINCINNIDYSKLEFIKKIEFTELSNVKFTYKNNNSSNLKLEEINNIYSIDDILKLDEYLKENCNLSSLENEQTKHGESSFLHKLISTYMNDK